MTLATLVSIVVILVVVGLLLWAVQQLPLDATIKNLIRVVVIVVVAIWLLLTLVDHTALHTRLW